MPKGEGAIQRPNTGRKTALDQELIKAKVGKKLVTFHLPFETDFSSASCSCKGFVEHVDIYSILAVIEGNHVWINKSFIVAVEV